MQKWRSLGVDFLIVLISAFLSYLMRENFQLSELWVREFIPYSIISAVGVSLGSIIFGTHKTDWKFVSFTEVIQIAKAVTLGLAAAIVFVFIFNRLDHVARSVPVIHWAVAIGMLVAARLVFRYQNNDQRASKTSDLIDMPEFVLVVGLSKITDLYLRCVSELAEQKIVVAGLLAEDAGLKGQTLRSSKVVGSPVELPGILAECNIHGQQIKKIVITTQFSQLSSASKQALLKCKNSGMVELEFFEKRLGFSTYLEDSNSPSPAVEMGLESVNDNEAQIRFSFGYRFCKRSFDIIVSALALVLLMPVTVIICAAVIADVGWPMTFWQVRPGRNGKPFRISKFRTMKAGHTVNGNRLSDVERTSRFGNWLRRSRLDEIPQLFNILSGDMSFVGPRPLLPIDQPDDKALRLSVRPGLTGWAQINGGKDLSIEQKGALDHWYVQNASTSLDLKILALTAYLLLNGNAANEQLYDVARPAGNLLIDKKEQPKSRVV